MNLEDSEQSIHKNFWPQTVSNWVELTLKVILVFASIGAVYQYLDVKQADRVKQTMEQLKNFNSGNLQTAQLKLNAAWEVYQKTFADLNQQTVASKEEKNQIQAKIVLSVIRHKNLQQEIGLLVDFFESLHVCIQHQICDKKVSQDFFGGYAYYFYRLHKPWIEAKRSVIPCYASQLNTFAYSIYYETEGETMASILCNDN